MPTKDLAGLVVGYSLGRLHMMGIVAGCVYLISTCHFGKVRRGPCAARLAAGICDGPMHDGLAVRGHRAHGRAARADGFGGCNGRGQSAANGFRSIAPILRASRKCRVILRSGRLVSDGAQEISLYVFVVVVRFCEQATWSFFCSCTIQATN